MFQTIPHSHPTDTHEHFILIQFLSFIQNLGPWKICTNAMYSLRMMHVLPPGDTTGSHEPPVLPPGGTTAHMLAAFWTPALSSRLDIAVDN